MKIRLLLTLAGLAISFALPAFAQQPNTPDPKLHDAFVAFCKNFDDGILNSDAAAVAAFLRRGRVLLDRTRNRFMAGRPSRKPLADGFQQLHFSKHVRKLEQYSPHIIGTAGNEAWMTGEWSVTFQIENGAPYDKCRAIG